MPIKNLINWKEIYKNPAPFHTYITARGRGKSDTKGWELLEIITTTDYNCAWIRRRWHDSLLASRPFFQGLIYDFCDKKKLNRSDFELVLNEDQFNIKEHGVYYQGKLRINFYDLFSFERLKGAIARVTFKEIVYEEAIPVDQEFLHDEKWKFRDLIKSLKGRRGEDQEPVETKVTFLANPNSWSAWVLEAFEEKGRIFELKKLAEEKAKKKDNSGVLEVIKDESGVEWLLYINLIEGEEDPHYKSLEEKRNPFLINWDDYMISIYTKKGNFKDYKIEYAIGDFFFSELGEREKNKIYFFMHFSRHEKEVDLKTTDYVCFSLEEKVKSKFKEYVMRDKQEEFDLFDNMIKDNQLFFSDFRSRDWFLEQIKGI